MTKTFKPETHAAIAGVAVDKSRNAVTAPIHLSTTYYWDRPDEKPDYDYSRGGNPTRRQLEEALCALEGAQGCVVTASGMAALDLILNLVDPGELVLAPHDCYGGTHRLFTTKSERGLFDLLYVDQTDKAALEAAFAHGPKLVFVETPSNPLLRITDIEDVVKRAKACGAIVIADNTFMSPALQSPLAMGCDIVVHSTTKFINGHSDVVGGAALAADPELGEKLAWWANCNGVTAGAYDCYMTLRGMRTLYARVERQQASAEKIVEALKDHAQVAKLYYPGLENHPGHPIAARQQRGFGAMFSAEFAAGVDVTAFLQSLQIFTIAESLGGYESLVCIPALMTHAAMSPEARAVAGLSDQLVRFSVGLEHPDDLKRDILDALPQA